MKKDSATRNAEDLQQKNYNMSVLEKLVSMIAPPDCIGCRSEGFIVCETCIASSVLSFGERCWRCNKLSINSRTCDSCKSFRGPRHIWVSTEYVDLASSLIKAYKFGHFRPAAKPIARLMVDAIKQYNDDKTLKKLNYLIVPLPTATSRRRGRGFDHTELVAKLIAYELDCQVFSLAGRLGQEHQVGKKREQRLNQLKGKYYISRPDKVAGRNILLIDDVVTTGGSLKELTALLRSNGAKRVDALVFAKRV